MTERINSVTPDNKVRVMKEKCATCIFHPGNLMSLRPGRVKDMVDSATKADSAIICHSTLNKEEQAVCRGFFDNHKTQPLQIAERLNRIEEVSC